MKKILTLTAALLPLLLVNALTLDTVFTSHMVLQRGKPVAFFGTAAPGSEVKAEFAGLSRTVKADAKGAWRAEFPAMQADHKVLTARISGDGKTISLDDLLIGDVWFCSGQSNMEMPIGKKFVANWSAKDCEKVVAAANDPELRYVKQKGQLNVCKRLPAAYRFGSGWVRTTPELADQFGATAYFFGRELRERENVPIGLVNASWSGSRIEGWISREGYEAAGLAEELAVVKKYDMTDEEWKAYKKADRERYPREIAEYMKIVDKAGAKIRAYCAQYSKPDFDDSDWALFTFPYDKRTQIRWYRTHIKLEPQMKGKDLTLETRGKGGEEIDYYLNGKRIGGWKAGDPASKKYFKVTLKPEEWNQEGDNVLAVRTVIIYDMRSDVGWIWKNYGKFTELLWYTKLYSGKANQTIWRWLTAPHPEFIFDWEKKGVKRPEYYDSLYTSPQCPATLYNGLVHSWTKLPIKGVIWYQGCGNKGEARYDRLHRALINDWRNKWNRPDLPFLIVQLAGYGDTKWQEHDPVDAPAYAVTREIQSRMLELPNVGLACAIDIGEADHIHPANKQEVGRRLALEAERIAYGKKIVSRGPIAAEIGKLPGAMKVRFINADGGLKTSDGKAPGAFAVAGADRKFVWANAKIDGDTVIVSSPKIKEPCFVRYAYADYRGDCNLQNGAGLPAYPFSENFLKR